MYYGAMHRIGGGFFGPAAYGYGGYIVMGIGIVLLGVLIYFLVKNRKKIDAEARETPLELLQKRFINGEISREQFLEMKEVIDKK